MSNDIYNENIKCPHCGYLNPPIDLRTFKSNKCEDCGRLIVKLSESPCDFSGDPAILVEEVKQPKLYQCPFDIATRCCMEEGCKGCKTWAESLLKKEKIKIEDWAIQYAARYQNEDTRNSVRIAYYNGATSEAAKQYWENYFKHN
jgi:hypothetical protein